MLIPASAMPIDVFSILFDVRGLRPDMLRFPRFGHDFRYLICDVTVQA